MIAVIRLEPCYRCRRDPGFGVLHTGCALCVRVRQEREAQPTLTVISREPLVFGERAPA